MIRIVLAFLVAAPALALGQRCPVVNGFWASLSGADSTRTASPRDTTTLFGFDSRTAVDTTWRINITERRWSRPQVTASVGGGWTGRPAERGTTTAPDSRAWSACASAAVAMRDPMLIVRGARGVVRLRADLTSLARIKSAARVDSSRPRRD